METDISKSATRQDIKPNHIDELAATAAACFGGGTFSDAMRLADAIGDLRKAMTPDVMKRFMALQNTSLGFRTDKDPSKSDKNGKPFVPYGEDVVRECLIEAVLRGVTPVGNQWNIITGRCYITREGFEYKLKKLPGFQSFKPVVNVPHLREGGAVVKCSATWVMNGAKDSLECEIAVRINEFQGSDAIIGKATRKFLKRVFEQATGSTGLPDGDASEDAQAPSLPEVPRAKFLEKSSTSKNFDRLKSILAAENHVVSDDVLLDFCRSNWGMPEGGDKTTVGDSFVADCEKDRNVFVASLTAFEARTHKK